MWLTLTGLCGSAVAQDLGARLLAAVRLHDGYEVAMAEAAATATTRELLDALAGVHDELGDVGWARLQGLLAPRYEEVLQAFVAEPERRAARAPVFGRLPLGWVQRHADATAEERAAIELLAPWLPWYGMELDEHLRRVGPDGPRPAEQLQRLWVHALHARSSPVLAALRRMQGDDAQAGATGAAIMQYGESPFALQPLLRDPDRFVRLRASIALRRSLGLLVPDVFVAQLAADPFAHRATAPDRPAAAPTAERLAALRTALAAGQQPDLAILQSATPAQRRECAVALLAGVRAPRRDAATSSPTSPPPPSPWDLSALGIALSSEPRLLAQWLHDAGQEGDVERTRWRVTAAVLVVDKMPLAVARNVAPLLLGLLAAPDAPTALGAAQLAAVAMQAGEVPDLQAAVVARALAAVPQLGTMQMGRFTIPSCDGTLPPRRPPEDATAVLMLAALRAGEAALRTPWLDALAAVRKAPDRVAREAHEHFLLFGLADIAASLDAATADRAWQLLQATPNIGAVRQAPSPQLLEWNARVGLLASVSEAMVPEVIERLRSLPEQVHYAAQCGVRVPAPRLRRYLEAVGLQDSTSGLHQACPDLLAAAWAAGGERAAAAARAVACIVDWPWTEEQLARGVLPRALVAAALAQWHGAPPPPLALLAACRDEAVFAPHLPSRLELLDVSVADLPRWRDLAQAADPGVAITACRRLAELGDAARPVLQEALARLCQKAADPAVRAQALTVAVELGIDVPDPAVCLASLATSGDGAVRCHELALRLRTGEVAVEKLPIDHAFGALVLAGHPFTAADRARLGDTMREHVLRQLAWQAWPSVLARVLDGAATLPRWSREFELEIGSATNHRAPLVRAAAYRALASRDPELWACAGLVAGAEFDPDPVVRAVAGRR